MKVYSYWNPTQEFANLHNRLARCIPGEECSAESKWLPTTDVVENENDYQLVLELPGIEREAINVKLESNSLDISGERKRTELCENSQAYTNERVYGEFSRRFKLPKDVDSTGLTAEFKNGLLEISLPKKKEAQPRSIEIKG